MKICIYTNSGFLHAIGNVVQSILSIIDSVVCILSFGYMSTNFTIIFAIYRLNTKFYKKRKSC